MKNAPVELTSAARELVGCTIREVCGQRFWVVHALNARTNHVHIVAAAVDRPEKVMTDLKAWRTRRLVEAGLFERATSVWARHGGTRYLWDLKSIADARDYVLNQQD